MNSDRAAERENRLREEKRKVEELLAEKKKEELIEARARQAQEIADLEAQLEAAVRVRIAESAVEGKMEVEKKRQNLEQMQKALDEQTKIRREQLNANAEILKDSEKVRQESLDALRDARKAEVAALNTKKLEINQKIHDARIAKEERLQMFDDSKNDEQKKILLKKEGIILNGVGNSAALLNSLALENNFEAFKQECRGLMTRHRKFIMEYSNIEPKLLTIHEQMKNGKKIEDCDMDGLRSALRVFRDTAMNFNSAGSTAETDFQTKIGIVIDLLTPLGSTFNKIESVIESYEGGKTTDSAEVDPKSVENVKTGEGIGSLLVDAENLMKEIGKLIQQFNVIGNDHLQKTLAIQMEQAQSSRNHHAIQNGPPAYDSTPKSKAAAITEN
uniref:Uncharacterized protein n=1 Tax=Caenorhabditis tropicalis TaxID=1561998 RepID=A0A1I7SZ08_9PELO